MIWRRMLHSAFRAGDETNARRVLKVALDPKTPEDSRKEAFRLLAEWTAPHPVDQSTGRVAPLSARDPEIIRKGSVWKTKLNNLHCGTSHCCQTRSW
jgi:hypothetical protein